MNLAIESAHHTLVLINACEPKGFIQVQFGGGRLIPKHPGAHAIMAGGSNERTWSDARPGRTGSLFFEVVLDGLQGRADIYPSNDAEKAGDGIITAEELLTYVRGSIQRQTNQIQNPDGGAIAKNKHSGSFFFLNRQRQVAAGNILPWDPESAIAYGESTIACAESGAPPGGPTTCSGTGERVVRNERTVGIKVGPKESLCGNELTLADAQQAIRQYRPGDNSIGLGRAVERVICETGELRNVTLDKADLTGLNVSNALLHRVSFVDAILSHSNFDRATIELGSLEGANLQYSSARGASFEGPNMVGTYWDCGDFTGARFENVTWRNVSAQSSVMRNAVFYRYGWEGVNLAYSDLRGVELFGSGADKYSNISEANVSGTDLRVFTDFFRGKLTEVFGINGACYLEDDPPVDSMSPDWKVEDGAYWKGEKLRLKVCGERTLTRSECQLRD